MTTQFEWDPAKAASNLRKHGVSFETAVRAFADPFALTVQDRVEYGEQRWRTIGAVGQFFLVLVVHVVQDEETDGQPLEIIRIISARKADRTERRRYEQETR